MFRRFRRVAGYCAVLVLPVGIYQGDTDSTTFMIGGYGGAGQVASVIRECGEPVSATKQSYDDACGGANLAIPPRQNSPMVLGVKYGYFNVLGYKFTYFNPSLSLEVKPIGLGMGLVSGKRPGDLSSGTEGLVEYFSFGDKAPDISMHLRVGDPRHFCLIGSINENTPLISGGGMWDVGAAWGYGLRSQVYLGLSIHGLYDTPGFLAQGRIPIADICQVTASFRYGSIKSIAETGISAGLEYSLGAKK